MFIKHLKDDPELQLAILQSPDQYYFQEKIDGSSVIFKIDLTGRLQVYRKLSHTLVNSNTVSSLIDNNNNFSAVSLINAYLIISQRVELSSLEPDKEYYAEIIDTSSATPAVDYCYDHMVNIYLFIFDNSVALITHSTATSTSTPSYTSLLELYRDKLKYSTCQLYQPCVVHQPPIVSFSVIDQEDQFNNAVKYCKNISYFGEIEGIVILNKDKVPISKIIPEYENFTVKRKKLRETPNFLRSARKSNVAQAAAWIAYFCNKEQNRFVRHDVAPERFRLEAKFNRNNEYISQYIAG